VADRQAGTGEVSGSGPTGLGWAWLGTRSYPEMLGFQELAVEARRSCEIGDTVLLLEHPPTYTLGRRTAPGEIGDRELHRAAGVEICETPRGGGVTWHGPGQLVAYPIIDLRGIGTQPGGAARVDVAGFVAALETAMAGTLAEWEVEAMPIEGLTGIWTGNPGAIPEEPSADSVAEGIAGGEVRKIGSIGLKVSRGTTSHGISLNLNCDVEPFERVTACGIEGCRVTSVLLETGHAPSAQEAAEVFANALSSALSLEPAGPVTTGLPEAADLTPNP
jgi:lipoyl(octanoyl) transferase